MNLAGVINLTDESAISCAKNSGIWKFRGEMGISYGFNHVIDTLFEIKKFFQIQVLCGFKA